MTEVKDGLADDLRAARALIDTPEKWTPNPRPRTKVGDRLALNASGAVTAALWDVRGHEFIDRLHATKEALEDAIPHGRDLVAFNSAATHADIMALFDRAINAALPEPSHD